MTVLPRVLSPADLPAAELSAARLDGELYVLGDGWAPIDVGATAVDRARAAGLDLPVQWTAELGTAAWIWGAAPVAPFPARYREIPGRRGPRSRAGVRLRQAVVGAGDVVILGGRGVTAPERTLLDLARTGGEWDAVAASCLLDLARLDAEGLGELVERARAQSLGSAAVARLRSLSPR